MGLVLEKNIIAFSQIQLGNKTYELNFPLRCPLEKEDDYWVIASDMLDIIGTGKTQLKAYENFSQEFDFIFNRYNELHDNQLFGRILNIKKLINLIVKVTEGSKILH